MTGARANSLAPASRALQARTARRRSLIRDARAYLAARHAGAFATAWAICLVAAVLLWTSSFDARLINMPLGRGVHLWEIVGPVVAWLGIALVSSRMREWEDTSNRVPRWNQAMAFTVLLAAVAVPALAYLILSVLPVAAVPWNHSGAVDELTPFTDVLTLAILPRVGGTTLTVSAISLLIAQRRGPMLACGLGPVILAALLFGHSIAPISPFLPIPAQELSVGIWPASAAVALSMLAVALPGRRSRR